MPNYCLKATNFVFFTACLSVSRLNFLCLFFVLSVYFNITATWFLFLQVVQVILLLPLLSTGFSCSVFVSNRWLKFWSDLEFLVLKANNWLLLVTNNKVCVLMAASAQLGTSSSSSVPSLPPPRPKSPPAYPDLYGKRRETAKVQMLEREIGFLEVSLFDFYCLINFDYFKLVNALLCFFFFFFLMRTLLVNCYNSKLVNALFQMSLLSRYLFLLL